MSQPIKHDVLQHINTTNTTIFWKVRPFSSQKFSVPWKEFKQLLKQIICRPDNSSWPSAIYLIPKCNGELQVILDA